MPYRVEAQVTQVFQVASYTFRDLNDACQAAAQLMICEKYNGPRYYRGPIPAGLRERLARFLRFTHERRQASGGRQVALTEERLLAEEDRVVVVDGKYRLWIPSDDYRVHIDRYGDQSWLVIDTGANAVAALMYHCAELRRALRFARSVIQAGEPWSKQCESIITGVLDDAAKTVGP